jgi:lysophospholipase L1-like esterase
MLPRRIVRRLVLALGVLVVATGLTACDDDGPSADAGFEYAALGDSFTAAPKIPNSSTDGCFRSDRNYAHRVAEKLDDAELLDVSCGGATAADIIQSQDQGDRVQPPQIEVVSADTDLVTVGMGVNDGDFSFRAAYECLQLAQNDPRGSPCTDANAKGLPEIFERIQQRLEGVYEAIAQRAPDARILAIGYPRLLPESGACPDRLPVAKGDVDFVRDAFEQLNETIEAAADESGVEYVDVAAAGADHDICAEEPWINGRKEDRRTKAAPYHPMPAEQAAVADLILDLL